MRAMEDYVRVAIHAMDNRSAWVFLSVVRCTADEDALECDACARRGAWRDGEVVRCFQCVPWGNVVLSKGFSRVGTLVATR